MKVLLPKETDCLTRIWKEKSLSEETSNICKCTIISFVEVYVFNQLSNIDNKSRVMDKDNVVVCIFPLAIFRSLN